MVEVVRHAPIIFFDKARKPCPAAFWFNLGPSQNLSTIRLPFGKRDVGEFHSQDFQLDETCAEDSNGRLPTVNLHIKQHPE
ncbi:hypothetical protein NC651_031997 [Populus alba x Populus x berolinensis]|nr:hypothetical protein NC651_031997 [Populus alba x Populus x berolinensis]